MTTRLSARRRIDFGEGTARDEGMKKGVEDIMNTMRPLKRKAGGGAADDDDDDDNEGKKGRRSSGSRPKARKEETEAGLYCFAYLYTLYHNDFVITVFPQTLQEERLKKELNKDISGSAT